MGQSRAGRGSEGRQAWGLCIGVGMPGRAEGTLGAAVDVVAHLHGAGRAGRAQKRCACLCRSHHLSFSCLEGQESPWTQKRSERSGQGPCTPGSTPAQHPAWASPTPFPQWHPPTLAGWEQGVTAPWEPPRGWGPKSIFSVMGMASPVRMVSVGSVTLCTSQRSCPTLTSCQPPAPASKVVAPAKAQAQSRWASTLPGGCAGTHLPWPCQPSGAWVTLSQSPPPPSSWGAGCLPAALTAAFLIRAVSACLSEVTGQLLIDAAPAVTGHLPSRTGAGTRPARQCGRSLL